jgi:uncharacterized caspase-like protein
MFENVRLDVLEMTLQRQEPMNLSRLQRRSSDIRIGSWSRGPGAEVSWTQRPALRHALVFANEYRDAEYSTLTHTGADGEMVSAALRASGYETTYAMNADRQAFGEAITEFRKRLKTAGPAAVGLVYFSGYGTSRGGENFLIPDGPIPSGDSDLSLEAIRLADLVTQLEAAEAQAVVVLVDCGRAFSLGGHKGIEPGFKETFGRNNVVIAYADAPGERHWDNGARSLFADAFARNVLAPDRIDIETVMARVSQDVREKSDGKQKPWFQTSLQLPIYFREEVLNAPHLPPTMAPDGAIEPG